MSADLKDLLQRAERRFSLIDRTQSTSNWLRDNTVLRGKPFTTSKFRFQESILNDWHPNLWCIKCSQAGLTTIMIFKILSFIKRQRGTTAMFTMPSEDLFKKFSTSRLKPALEENQVTFSSEDVSKPVRNSGLYQVGTSFLHVTGTTEGDATSTPSDILFHDEVDLMNQEFLSLFQSRLQRSDFKITQRFSTPTHVNYAMDAGYQTTDQREYICKCSKCGTINIPDFTRDNVHISHLPDDIENLHDITEETLDTIEPYLDSAYVKCSKCHSALDLDSSDREWVATYPSRSLGRGYRVLPFSSTGISIPYIIGQLLQYRRSGSLRRFHNTVLGRAYTSGDTCLTRDDVVKCFTEQAAPLDVTGPCYVGIDMGLTCHIIIVSPLHGIVLMETCDADLLEARVKSHLKTYEIDGGTIDRHPYTPTANKIRDLSDKKILPIEYRGSQAIKLVLDELGNLSHIQAERTTAIDAMVQAIRNRLSISGYSHQKELIIKHLTDNVRDEPLDAPAVWLKRTGEDHYAHALTYALLGMKVNAVCNANKNADNRSMFGCFGMNWMPASSGLLVPSKEQRRVQHAL